MQIETTRFGALDIDEAGIITFADGIPGFEASRRFALIPHGGREKDSPFYWLQSLDDGKLAFLLTDPRCFFADYAPIIAPADRQALIEDGSANDLTLFTLLTVPKGDPAGITANLLAPLAINQVTGMARQIIVGNERYGLRHRLIPEQISMTPGGVDAGLNVTPSREGADARLNVARTDAMAQKVAVG